MEVHVIFLYLAILLFFARLTGNIFAKFGIPSVLGEIFVGILLGQSVFGIVPLNDIIRLLAEMGIILLLFHIGLEADLKQLKRVGFSATTVAITGALFPMIAGFFGFLLCF
ncbi:cation:proton antiporter [Thermodesulfobacterium geofontis]|uniref:cation:proton antiporter n=1 Tax=Thermodesulfobacterium geofontis TaxID=1295609 RepID=UPI0002F6AE4B|nr:cation:proton antiporter [Thermodesulfobacterium geofontis]